MISTVLKQNNLIIPSAHYRLGVDKTNGEDTKGTMLHEWDKAVDDAAAAGIKHMVCAWLSPAERGNIDNYKLLAERCNKAAETCKKAGIQFCYHNHDFEFAEQNCLLATKDCVLYLQTEWSKQEQMLPLMIDYVKANPQWKISLQTHKYLNIP